MLGKIRFWLQAKLKKFGSTLQIILDESCFIFLSEVAWGQDVFVDVIFWVV